MRGYGRDYNDRNWLERAGETVRGWFGGGRDYDRDYGGWESERGAGRGYVGRGYDRVDWNDRGNTWNTVGRGWSAGQGGYGWDRGGDWNRNEWGDRDRGSYGGHRMGAWSGGGRGYDGGYHGGGRYDTEYDRGYTGRETGGYPRGGQGDPRMGGFYGQSGNYGNRSSFGAGLDWGDYGRGGYGGDLFRNMRSGGVEPGRYYRGYGIGSSGGHGYEPY